MRLHKTCTKCGENKPLNEFNRRRDVWKGKWSGEWIPTAACKECEHEAHQRRYRQSAEMYRDIAKRYRRTNKEKVAAMNYLNNNIRSGDIVRPEVCPLCDLKPVRGVVCGSFRGDWRNGELQWACRACRTVLASEGETVPVHCHAYAPLPDPARSRSNLRMGPKPGAGHSGVSSSLGELLG